MKTVKIIKIITITCLLQSLTVMVGCSATLEAEQFESAWPRDAERIWVGPEYWANRLQDWRLSNGRLECVTAGNNRTVYLLTCQTGKRKGDLRMSVRLGSLGKIGKTSGKAGKSWVGFRIGARGIVNDYRNAAIYGKGLDVGITTSGRLFIGRPEKNKTAGAITGNLDDIELHLSAKPSGNDYQLSLSCIDSRTQKRIGQTIHDKVSADSILGSIALVCHIADGKRGQTRFWFRNWKVAGSKIDVRDERKFGPILFSQYTLSRNILKMTAQMPPTGKKDSQYVRLQVRRSGQSGKWNTIGKAKIDKLARTATFRIANWDSSRDTPYRLAYAMLGPDGQMSDYYYTGTIRRDPVGKDEIVVAGFTGNNDLGFPNTDVVKNIKFHNPDVLVFTGDQIYESVAGYGCQRKPLEKATLDYLRKWYLFGWSFGDLTRNRPTVCMPDDHDVYHGNIWGKAGQKAKGPPPDGKYPPHYKGRERIWGRDQGGYEMPADWVKMVERTQTSHLPDPYDPTPVQQGIGVYYCNMNYGGVSFAIIEDRKFKSSPSEMVPKGKVVNGWFQNPDFDPATQSDVPDAKLLGERQLQFLHNWSADWSGGTWMKVVLSQTIFANVATLPSPATTDAVVPKLRLVKPGEYPPNDQRVADADSNGWPQTGRNKALREIRRCFAFHLAGDQHLGSTIHYGIDEYRDSGFALCVPSIANFWPRRWYPSAAGLNRKAGSPKYTGDFKDGFGNLMTVHAISNPVISGRKPTELHDRAPGYGIVKFDRDSRNIIIECRPRWADPAERKSKNADQYPGWPITINQTDNYARKAVAYLPTIKVEGMDDPVVQVIDESNKEIVYTLRIRGRSFRPMVFKEGIYTVRIGEPDTKNLKTLSGLSSVGHDNKQKIQVKF